jgi:3-isopropylmalate dehydrogenase
MVLLKKVIMTTMTNSCRPPPTAHARRSVSLQLHYIDSTIGITKFINMKLPSLTILALTSGTASAFAPTGVSFGTSTQSARSSSLNAVSKKDSYQITLLPGDGIGPEIMSATKGVLAALTKRCNFELHMTEALIGGAAIDAKNDPFPDESFQQCLSSDSVLLSCIGGYKWDANPRELRPESGLLKMRKQLGLFANLRPAKVLDQLIDASTLKREVVEGVDVMVVRELTGDVYFGTPKGIDVVDGKESFVF